MRIIVLAAMTAVTGVVSGFDSTGGWTESFEDFTPNGEGVSLREKFALDGKKVKIPATTANQNQYTITDYPRWVADNSSTNHTVQVSVDGNAYVGTNYMTIVDKDKTDKSGQVNARLRFKPAGSSETGFKFVALDKVTFNQEHPNSAFNQYSDFNEFNFKFRFRNPANYVSAPVPAAATCDVFDSLENFVGVSGAYVDGLDGQDGKSTWSSDTKSDTYKAIVVNDGQSAYAGQKFLRIVDGRSDGNKPYATKTFAAPGEGETDTRPSITSAASVPFSFAVRRSLCDNQGTASLTGCNILMFFTNVLDSTSKSIYTEDKGFFHKSMSETNHWYFLDGELLIDDGKLKYNVNKIYDATSKTVVNSTSVTVCSKEVSAEGDWRLMSIRFMTWSNDRGYVDIDAISIGGAGASHAQQGESSTTEDETSGSDSGEESHDQPGSGVSLSFNYSFKTNDVFVTQTMSIPLSKDNFAYDTWYKFKTKVNNVHWDKSQSQLLFVDTMVTRADTGAFVIGWKNGNNGPTAHTSQSEYDDDIQTLRANIQLKVDGMNQTYYTDVYLDSIRFMSWNDGEVLFDIDDFQFDRKYGVMILLL